MLALGSWLCGYWKHVVINLVASVDCGNYWLYLCILSGGVAWTVELYQIDFLLVFTKSSSVISVWLYS